MSKPRRTLAALAAGLTLTLVAAPAVQAARGQSVNLTTRVSSFYDDNFLQYSGDQLQDFQLALHPDRYSIKSSDDLILNPSLAMAWDLDSGRERRHSLRLKGEGNFHRKNRTADFHSLSIGWRESWSRDRRLNLSWYVLPRYYLRQLFDDDAVPVSAGLTKYRRADLRLHIASADWSQRIARNVLLDLGYQYENRDYNHDFDERDSGLHQGEVGVSFVRMPHRGTVSLVGRYRVSHARGEDGDEPETVPDPDVSYRGLTAALGGRMDLAQGGPWRLTGDLAYALETRNYDSDRPTDKYHFGRDDILHAAEVGLRAVYRTHWSLRGFYRFESNSATLGAPSLLSSDAGSYRANQAGLALEWSSSLRKKASSEPKSDPEAQP